MHYIPFKKGEKKGRRKEPSELSQLSIVEISIICLLWRAVPLCLFWAIWKERNRVVFDDEVFSKSRLKSCFLFSFSSWAGLWVDVEHPFTRDIFNIP